MSKCIACLPNGTMGLIERVRELKKQGLNYFVFRESDKKDWQISKSDSFKVIKENNKKNKNFEFVHVREFKETEPLQNDSERT